MEMVLNWDREITLAINRFHFEGLDAVMIFWSAKWVWIPLYVLIIGFLYKSQTRRAFFTSLGFLMVAVALSDQTASALFKPLFMRLRPCHQPDLLPFLHLPDGCGGQFGFASSHAANTFCLATWIMLSTRIRYWLTLPLFIWALITGWSRIYLGAHYLGDVLVGYSIGFFWSSVCFLLWKKQLILSNASWKP